MIKKNKLAVAILASGFLLSTNVLAEKNQPLLIKEDSFTIDLLSNNNEDLAIKYFNKEEEEANKFFIKENGNMTSDIIVALENGHEKYLKNILPKVKNINATFRYNNVNNYTLFMVFAKTNKISNKEDIMRIFEKMGVKHNIINSNGDTAFDVAYKNNNYFFKELYLIVSGNEKVKMLLENDPLKDSAIKIQNKIVNNLNNGLLEELKLDKNKLFETYIDFIVSGYNEAAFLLEDEIKNFEKENKRGITPLMAAAISIVDGGNVDYAKRLIEKGVNINQITDKANGANAAMLSMVRDNYKVATLLFLNNLNYEIDDKDGNNIFEYAIKYNAVKSMLIIRSMMK